MKIKEISVFLFVVFLAACAQPDHRVGSKQEKEVKSQLKNKWVTAAKGEKITEIKEKIEEDKHQIGLIFYVSVIATENSALGVYLVSFGYGYSKHEVAVTLPRWVDGSYPKPILRKGTKDYDVRLGFDIGDGKFRPLYKIYVEDKSIRMKKTDSYVLSTPDSP